MQVLQAVMYSNDAEGTLLGSDSTVVGDDCLKLGVPRAVYRVGEDRKNKKKVNSSGKTPVTGDSSLTKKYASLFLGPLPRQCAHTVPEPGGVG